eukprot:6671352-Prorocentrum_lima.AAC.1
MRTCPSQRTPFICQEPVALPPALFVAGGAAAALAVEVCEGERRPLTSLEALADFSSSVALTAYQPWSSSEDHVWRQRCPLPQ